MRPAFALSLLLAATLFFAAPARAAGDAAPKPCRVVGLKQDALCGQVGRALDPAAPAGRQIDIGYVVLPAMARNKQPDPVFLFAGGPGQSATQLAGMLAPLFNRLNNRRDIVFVDQRGTGRSAPLVCPEDAAPSLAQQLDAKAGIARLEHCRAALQKLSHGDLRLYTTTIAMADVDAVRAALGAPQVNLVGASYGTRAALEYLRQFPARVRRMVIDGVAPPDMVLPASFAIDNQAALDATYAACEADTECNRRHPRLRERWRALVASLPKTVQLADPATGEPQSLTLTRDMVAGALRGPLYAPSMAAALPYAMAEAVEGRFTPLIGLSGALGGGRGLRLAWGMHFSVICAEDMPLLDALKETQGRSQVSLTPSGGLTRSGRSGGAQEPMDASPDFGAEFAGFYRSVCRDWPRGTVPVDFYRIAPSAAPALLLSGTLDPVTPPRHAARVAAALGAKARNVVVPNAGHGILGLGCTRDVVYRFIDAQDETQALKVDAACLARLPRPPMFEPWRPVLQGDQS